MKAKCLGANEVELKRGDEVAVYETLVWGLPTRGAAASFKGSGVVVRAYRHIGAVVVGFRVGERKQFISTSDARYSVYRLS